MVKLNNSLTESHNSDFLKIRGSQYIISSSIEYLHFGCNKAEGSKGRKKVARKKGTISDYPNLILLNVTDITFCTINCINTPIQLPNTNSNFLSLVASYFYLTPYIICIILIFNSFFYTRKYIFIFYS